MPTKQIDLTDRIERMPELEDKWGIHLTGLFASATEQEAYDENGQSMPSHLHEIAINGEVEAESGGNLQRSLDLVITLHDEQGRVLAKLEHYLDADDFFALRAFACTEHDMRTVPAKIRMYAQSS